ncbi:hypothetical protein A2W14_00345 [Candidatus Gottesmanbacteria bacterium RBG_16_37_8]|uniref:Uncharacterized protein n=1 Tax=Candidatus Gottesmanbacteria bacterium RBG_16_37_8 TaxID=1798371 RepID=A0A1F5YT38_9BACT|nr:MAG: hypothetical protein A2W14_00345 [Candidatus Gottesmanbacteria bacterium RBG_16_37_8]
MDIIVAVKILRLFAILIVLLILMVIVDSRFQKETETLKKQNKETKISPTNTPTPTAFPSPTIFLPNDTPTPVVQNESNNNTLIYPNSTVISETGNLIVLQNNDDPQTITDWYKQKIESLNLNAKSYVVTNANGNVLNKLVGASGNMEVRVEIIKKASESIVEIKVGK